MTSLPSQSVCETEVRTEREAERHTGRQRRTREAAVRFGQASSPNAAESRPDDAAAFRRKEKRHFRLFKRELSPREEATRRRQRPSGSLTSTHEPTAEGSTSQRQATPQTRIPQPPSTSTSQGSQAAKTVGGGTTKHVPSSHPFAERAAQTSHVAQETTGGHTTGFLAQLATLKEGTLFAEKYKIETDRIQGKRHCRYAIERSTGRSVFLKFFPRGSPQFGNAVRKHDILSAGHKRVCTLIETVTDLPDIPLCLVFERGRYTLLDRMEGRPMPAIERRAILYLVLEALEYIHSRGITHGNLTPLHIMWFSNEFTWKLVDLDHASLEGEPATVPPIGRYAPPEYIDAEKHGTEALPHRPSADMWAFGTIAFEVLTASSVVDSVAVQEAIDTKLGLAAVAAERSTQRWLSADPRGRIRRAAEEYNLRFVQTLLRKNPGERRTATDALEDPLFRSAPDAYQRMSDRDTEGIDLPTGSSAVEIPEWAWIVALSNHLDLVVDLEYLPEGKSTDVPFWMQTGEQAWRFEDDYLSEHSVNFIRLGKIYRLHIRVMPSNGSGITVHRIISVVAKPPDGDSVPLTIKQRYLDDGVVALALFDPAGLESQRLQRRSQRVGTVQEKYVNVQVFVKLMVGGLLARELEFYKTIYCKVIQPRHKLRLYSCLGMIENKGVVRRPFEMD